MCEDELYVAAEQCNAIFSFYKLPNHYVQKKKLTNRLVAIL